eukprot:362019-Chlamydomonas_euryale.AAC.3
MAGAAVTAADELTRFICETEMVNGKQDEEDETRSQRIGSVWVGGVFEGLLSSDAIVFGMRIAFIAMCGLRHAPASASMSWPEVELA